jgi:hypothetical protein
MHSSYPPGCQLYAIVFQKFGAAVCTENLIRFDLVTESLKRRPRWSPCCLRLLASPFRSNGRLEAENATLRQQLIVLQRKVGGRAEFTNGERLFFIQLYRWFPSILKVMTTIWPETLVRWHRGGFRRYWRWKSRNPRTRHSPSLVIFGHR